MDSPRTRPSTFTRLGRISGRSRMSNITHACYVVSMVGISAYLHAPCNIRKSWCGDELCAY